MKYYLHGHWAHDNDLLAFMYRGEDGLIYYESTIHTRERKLRLLPEGAEVIEGVAWSSNESSEPSPSSPDGASSAPSEPKP